MGVSAKPKKRSPDYPGVSLKVAIERANKVYEAFENHPMPRSKVLALWGYSPGSGPGLVSLGALKKFGLLVAHGRGKDGTVGLTDAAYAYFDDEREDQTDRTAFVRKAAMAPAIHKEIFARYKASPKTDVLKHFLKTDKGFTPSGADSLISEYLETMAFAEIGESDTVVEDAGDETGGGPPPVNALDPSTWGGPLMPKPKPRRPKERAMPDLQQESRDLTIPISGGRMAILRTPTQLSPQDYHFLAAYLDVMKEAIITTSLESPVPDASDEEH